MLALRFPSDDPVEREARIPLGARRLLIAKHASTKYLSHRDGFFVFEKNQFLAVGRAICEVASQD